MDQLISKYLKINQYDYPIEEYRQIRYIILTVIFISITMAAASVTRFIFVGAVETLFAVMIINPLMLLSLFFLHQKKHAIYIKIIIISLIIVTAAFAVIASGGILSPMAFWLVGLPLLFGAMVSIQHYFRWVVIVLLIIIYLPIHQKVFIDHSFSVTSDAITFTRFRMLIFLVTISSILIYFYKKTIEETVLMLSEKKEQLNNLLKLVGHDLATPLNVIGGAIRQLKKENVNSKYLTMMDNSYNAMTAILQRTKDMRALDTGKMVLTMSVENLLNMCKESIEYFDKQLLAKAIILDLNVRPEHEVKVDRLSFIHQVLNNILSNAIKFSHPSGKIKIYSQEENGNVSLIIEDFGIGIPQELQKELFVPNANTTRLGTSSERGTGFGMLLVKEHLNQYHATLELQSQENVGTKVLIHFLK